MDYTLFEQLLNLSELRVTHLEQRKSELIVHCEAQVKTSVCPSCQQRASFVKQQYPRMIKDLPISGTPVTLKLTVRQYVCEHCDRNFSERFDCVATHVSTTRRYDSSVFKLCVGMSLQHVCALENLSPPLAERIFQQEADKLLSGSRFENVRCLGIDEIALRKGHGNYAAVIVNLDTREVLDILPYRDKERLRAYFLARGNDFCSGIRLFCSDMWSGYLSLAEEIFPGATVVIDRFHFYQSVHDQVDYCRKHLRKHYPKETECLKNKRWSLLKREENLTPEQQTELTELLETPALLPLKSTYNASRAFQLILDKCDGKAEAEKQLSQWRKQHENSGNRFVKNMVKFFDRWKKNILNYFFNRGD